MFGFIKKNNKNPQEGKVILPYIGNQKHILLVSDEVGKIIKSINLSQGDIKKIRVLMDTLQSENVSAFLEKFEKIGEGSFIVAVCDGINVRVDVFDEYIRMSSLTYDESRYHIIEEYSIHEIPGKIIDEPEPHGEKEPANDQELFEMPGRITTKRNSQYLYSNGRRIRVDLPHLSRGIPSQCYRELSLNVLYELDAIIAHYGASISTNEIMPLMQKVSTQHEQAIIDAIVRATIQDYKKAARKARDYEMKVSVSHGAEASPRRRARNLDEQMLTIPMKIEQ